MEVRISWSAGTMSASDRQHFSIIIVILLRQRSGPQGGREVSLVEDRKFKKIAITMIKSKKKKTFGKKLETDYKRIQIHS